MTPIKGLGHRQRVILAELAKGDWLTANELADITNAAPEAIRSGVKGLRDRGLVIETQDRNGGMSRGYKLHPYPDRPWLPVSMIPDFYQMTAKGEFTQDEARRIIEDHIATIERRSMRLAA